MSNLTINIYTKLSEMPVFSADNPFHSAELFALCKDTPRQTPYMIVAQDASGAVAANMLAVVRHRSSWFPPYYYMHCRVVGEGEYRADVPQDEVFGQMLQALIEKLSRRVLYIEVSNLSQKMFGYRQFRQNHFFPIHWMSIHNSLHSRTPEERISERMLQRINAAYKRGVTTETVSSEEDFTACSKLLHQHNWLKPKRYIPHDHFFRGIMTTDMGRLFVTKYHGHVIGCSVCVYSGRNAFLWYSAYRRKSYAFLHPDELTIWHAIKDAHQRGYDHIFFLDVGLPFQKNPYREFILSFGGKPVSTYRWFHCTIGWLNRLLSWIYRD